MLLTASTAKFVAVVDIVRGSQNFSKFVAVVVIVMGS